MLKKKEKNFKNIHKSSKIDKFIRTEALWKSLIIYI